MIIDNIINIVSLAIILLIAIWLHEYAHAYVSYKLWDPTPKLQWRLTTNPLKHIDIIGFLSIFLIWFWRWKPVQINPNYYKNPIKWELMVALAWPITNLWLSIIWIFLFIISWKIFWLGLNDILLWNYHNFLTWFFLQFSIINICLAVFNLIPLPPLDWFRIVKTFLPKIGNFIEKYTLYISIIFILMIVLRQSPINTFLSNTSYTIFKVIFTFFSSIFY